MRRLIVAAVAVAAGGVAWASGYDDYMRGYDAQRAGQFDLALSSFTAALAAGDLAAVYVPDVRLGRADALFRNKRCAEALSDLDAALSLRPKMTEALLLRIEVNDCLGKREAALTDADAVVAMSPTPPMYTVRGDWKWYYGDFGAAAEDYMQAVKLHPKHTHWPEEAIYSLLSYAITAARAKTFDAAAFAAAADGLPDDVWPAPLMAYIAGKTGREAVYREAAKGDDPAQRKCLADFFIGEWQYATGDPAGKVLLAGMEQTCPKNDRALEAARHELKRLH